MSYPADFHKLNETNDYWIDEFKAPNTGTPKIYTAFKTWYNFLATKAWFHYYERPSGVLLQLQFRLKNIHLKNPGKYANVDDIYRRFSASMARCFQIFCTIHYKVYTALGEVGRQYPHLTFPEVFFSIVGTWYFSPEDVAFLNVILDLFGEHPSDPRVKFILAVNRLGETVAIPYEKSGYCGVQNVSLPSNLRTLCISCDKIDFKSKLFV